MWETIKMIGGTIVYYVKQVPHFIVAAPSMLDTLVYNGLGILNILVTEKLNVHNVSAGWNIWRRNLLNNQLEPDESSEPFSSAVHSMEDKPNTAPLVNMAYKMGITMLLTALGLGAVLLFGPIVALPLGIILGGVSLLKVSGYMDSKLYKILLQGLTMGLGIALIIGLTTLFPPLLALPAVGGMIAIMINPTMLLVSLCFMFGLSLLSTSIAGIVDDGGRGIGRALATLALFPFYASVYTISASASFAWDLFWWPFHGFFFQVYDPARNWVRETWPKVKQALGEKWVTVKEVLNDIKATVVNWVSALFNKCFSQPKVDIKAEIVEPEIEELDDFAEKPKNNSSDPRTKNTSPLFWQSDENKKTSENIEESEDDDDEELSDEKPLNGFNKK